MVEALTVALTVARLIGPARTLLNNRHFSQRLATRVRKLCKRNHDFTVSRRALKRCLRSEEALALLTSLDPRKLPEIAALVNRRVIQRRRTLSEDQAASRSIIVAKHLLSELLVSLDPSYSVAVLHKWLEAKLGDDPDLSRLPPSCWDSWEQLHDINFNIAINLKQLLEEHGADIDIVSRVLEDGESDHWLSEAPYQVWIVLGNYFLAHGAGVRASELFLKAVQYGAPKRAILFAHAGWLLQDTDSDEALRVAERATVEQDDTGIAVAIRYLLSSSPDEAIKTLPNPLILSEDSNTQLLGMSVRVAALVEMHKRGEALDLLRSAINIHPNRGMLRLVLVQTISDHVSTLPTGHIDGETLLAEAADQAAAAIPLLRQWNGPTDVATEFACDFYRAAGNLQRVLAIGMLPPHGAANADDLSPAVRLSVIVALIMLGDLQSAVEFSAAAGTTDFETSYMAAVKAESSEDSNPADGYYEALGVATTSLERFLVLMALARHGVTDLPEMDDLDLESEQIDLIRATAALAATDYMEVVRISRGWRNRSSPHALTHAEALDRSGNRSAAIDELRASAERFRDAHFVALAVELLVEERRPDRAVEIALDGLARYQGSPRARWQLRYRMIEIAGDRGDWSTAESHSRALIDEFPDDPRAKWLLIQSLAQRQRHEHAWEAFQEHRDLEVFDEATAVMKIQLRCRFEQGPDVIEMALGLIDEFPDSEVVAATAIQGVLSIAQHLDLPEELESELAHLIPRFIDRFPDSPYLRPVAIDMQDPVESLRPYLEPQAEIREELLRRALYGEIPIGLASDLCGEPYILHCLASSRCSIPVNNQETETSAATASLGSEIVVDTTALVPFIQLDTPVWIAQHFERMLIPDVLVDDVHGAIDYVNTRGSGTMGWDVLADRFTARELTPEDITEARLPLERLLEIVSATLDTVSSVQAPALPGLESDDFGAWLATVRVAKERNIPLYSDDLALRNLARAVGVTAFDNYAVIQALLANGRIGSDVSEGRCRDLMRAHVMDMPFDERRYSEMAAENDFGPGPVTVSLARPAAWIDPRRTAQWFTLMTRRIHEAGQSDQVPFWLAAASVGATLNAPAYNRLVILGQLLAASLTQSRLFGDILPQLVAASRQAARYLGLDPDTSDPLRASVPIIMGAVRATSNQMGGMVETSNLGDIGSTTLQMFEALPPEDKQIVVEAIITDR